MRLQAHKKPPTRSRKKLTCEPGLLDSKFAVTHDGEAIHFDSAATWDDINMNFGIPIGACKFGIWIAKGNVQAGHLFVLQQVTA